MCFGPKAHWEECHRGCRPSLFFIASQKLSVPLEIAVSFCSAVVLFVVCSEVIWDMQSDSDDSDDAIDNRENTENTEEMAPDIVTEKNGRFNRFQHCSVPRSLKEESERLKTFKNWNVSFLNCKKLAEKGFYYTDREDIVKCAFCGVEVGSWNEGDEPNEFHKKWRCPIVAGRGSAEAEAEGEVEGDGDGEGERERVRERRDGEASGGEEEGEGEGEVKSQDVCGSSWLELRPYSAPERPAKTPFGIMSNNLWKEFEELGVSKVGGPVTPHLATYNSRIKTFEKWPIPRVQPPESLAEAGFYYIGVNDKVLCFHCGGGLMNWEAEDDPWVEHAQWFWKCGFVVLRKGREFVNEVLNKGLEQLTEENVKEVGGEKAEVKQKKENEEKKSTKVETVSEKSKTYSTEKEKEKEEEKEKEKEKENNSCQSSDIERKEIELCRICYVRERGVVFLPCGHFVSCTQCAPSLSTCAVCRKPFKFTVRAYLS